MYAFAIQLRWQVERVSRRQPGRKDRRRRGERQDGRKEKQLLESGGNTVTAGKNSRSSSLYDSEIINYCFVCRHISFVTVKRHKDLTWSFTQDYPSSWHKFICNYLAARSQDRLRVFTKEHGVRDRTNFDYFVTHFRANVNILYISKLQVSLIIYIYQFILLML